MTAYDDFGRWESFDSPTLCQDCGKEWEGEILCDNKPLCNACHSAALESEAL